jgi:DNA-binding response OmpR family regulator
MTTSCIRSRNDRSAGGAGRTDATRAVLVVDDDQAVALPIARYFRRLGWSADVASERAEAEALAAHRRYDLAILDLHLAPWGDAGGLEVLAEIGEASPRTPVVMLSGHVSDDARKEAERRGARAVLAKPQPLPELARFASALVEAARA